MNGVKRLADLQTNAANDLLNEILMVMMRYDINIQELKGVLYGVLHNYQITSRTTDLVVYEGDINTALLKKFLVVKTVNGCTGRTIEMYGQTCKRALCRMGKPATEISTDDIRWYIAMRMKDGVTNVTCNNELRALSSFFTWMRDDELIQQNPVMKTGKIKVQKTKKYAFTDDDIEMMRVNLVTWREKAMFELLLSTGCRVTELANIKIDDIKDGSVNILGKGNKWRTVYINARAKLALEKYIDERKDGNPYLFPKAAFGPGTAKPRTRDVREWYKHPDLVHADEPTTNSSIESYIRKLGRRSGVENAHPHRFRRTCATMALKRGMPIELVSKMLGHDSIATTQIYLDLNDDDLKAAHRKYVT